MWRRSGDGERLSSSDWRGMRITRSVFILTGLLLVAGDRPVIGQPPKYGVTVSVGKTAELAKAKTYSWTASQPAFDKTVDAQIVAAVDRELTALGLTKVASGKSDLLATYASQRRTDVELKASRGPGVSRRRPHRRAARPGDQPAAVPRADRQAARCRTRPARTGHQRGGEGDVREIPDAHPGDTLTWMEEGARP